VTTAMKVTILRELLSMSALQYCKQPACGDASLLQSL
jgi:hypothetical protein